MSGLPFAALVLCLCITAGESQQFTIFVERSQLSVTVGGNALFSVRPSGNVISGNWSFNGETIAQWINQTVTVDKAYTSRAYVFISNGSLLLKSLNMSDNGEYRVTIVPTNGSRTSATIFLRVIEPVSNVTVTSNATRLIEYSDSVAITCFARGTEVSYLWLKENSPIIPGGRFELSADNSTLAVSGVRRTDENFTCRASNLINSSTSAPFHLDVYYGPDRPYIITQPNSSLHVAGSTIRLTCLTQSRPVAELKWRLNGAHPQSGQVLNLDNISVSQTGNYTCEAYNDVTNRNNTSTTQIKVFEPVSNVTVTSNATRLIEYSDSVAITCFARGTEVSYLWLKENSPIIPGGRFELSADNSTLAVSGVRRTDENFTCRASNLINSSTSAPFHLDVYYGPDRPYIITQPNSSLHVAGSTIRLTCLTQSRPVAELKWRLNGAHPQSGQVLILDNISVCQTGNYTCEAYNTVTNRNNTSTTQINVLAKTDGIFTLGSGAIAGIMLGLLGVGLIGGITGWLTARKTGGIKDPPQSKHDTSTNSGKNSTLDTNAADASQNYENFPGNEQGTMDNADDGNSTHMGLVLQDRSAYSDLKR
ncbi:cell adhesion molecule CEACAM5-like [Mobula birostris]|uniref:cell adhesion molecule CEACAM5-like n=1 Tax=Mobula birostris TaxID=1983395 RepID=UPI003B28CE58